jgi:hypothetical protein
MSQGAVSEAAKSGTTLDLLIATRERIAMSVDDPKTTGAPLAALTKRLMDIAKEIESIETEESEESEDAPTPDESFDPATL